jgi:hypothetical protein
MTGPSSTPRGEHAGRPGAAWNTVLVSTGEQLADDNTPTPRPNRATRRAAMRAQRRETTKEQPMPEPEHRTETGVTIANPQAGEAQRPDTRPRTFGLIRDHDVTGISGTGRIADGVLWPDGSASVRWRGDRPSTVWWASFADVLAIHGHGGYTRVVWDDEQQPDDPGVAHAAVGSGSREQLHIAIRALARLDPQWWRNEINRMARVEGHTQLLNGRR